MPKLLEIQQGIWIDEQLLRRAGVGAQCQVVVQPGEIRNHPACREFRITVSRR